MLTVHLRINDAATGTPTPVRLRISGADGTTFAPLGRFAEFPVGRNQAVGGHLLLGREPWCVIDGHCEVKLPAGVPLRVQATKGPEYTPLDETVTLGPGKMALRFAVQRWIDMAAEGWITADSRCHFLSPHDALFEAAAEDLSLVNLLATVQPYPSLDGTLYPTATNLAAFSGQVPALEAGGRTVVVNTLNVHPVLGTVGLLNSHRPVYPLTFGGEESDDWSVCDWCDQCRRKGGLTVWADPFRPAGGLIGGEALVAAVLGKIDAIELDPAPRQQPVLPWVYHLWNAGFPIPLVGGSGKDGNRVPLGGMRTYARLHDGDTPSYKPWVEAVRSGRTVVTNAPLLTFDVSRTDNTAVMTTRSPFPLSKIEIVSSLERLGETAARIDDTTQQFTLPNTGSYWVAARCFGADGAFAHTSPVVIRNGDAPLTRRPEAVAALTLAVERTREWVEKHGRFEQAKSKQHLLDLCDQAVARLGGGP